MKSTTFLRKPIRTTSKKHIALINGFQRLVTYDGCSTDAHGPDCSQVWRVKSYAAMAVRGFVAPRHRTAVAHVLYRVPAALGFGTSLPVSKSAYRTTHIAHGVSI